MMTALILILLGITMIALAVIGSEPPHRIQAFGHSWKEHRSEHAQSRAGVARFADVAAVGFLGVAVVVKLLL